MKRSGILIFLVCSACLRPGLERAEADLEVGIATEGPVSVLVANGLAAVQSIGADHVAVWMGAPAVELQLSHRGVAPTSFSLEALNGVAGLDLRVESAAGDVAVTEFARMGKRSTWTLSLQPPVDARIRLEPPGVRGTEPFQVALLSDVQEAIEDVQDIYDLINLEDVDFVVGAGDLTEQGGEDELLEFRQALLGLDFPYYTTLGNHELGHSPPPFQQLFGRASFSYEYRGVRFTYLDSGSASIDPLVYLELEGWLSAGEDQVHIVSMHMPPLDPAGVRNGAFGSRREAARLLGMLAAADVDLTLYGHVHTHIEFENAGIPARISGGGGAIPERFDGIGRHFLVIDVDPVMGIGAIRVVRVDP